MSMNAIFVQVEDAEIARFEAAPDSVEALFANETLPTGRLNMTDAMQQRLRAIGPLLCSLLCSRNPNTLKVDVPVVSVDVTVVDSKGALVMTSASRN